MNGLRIAWLSPWNDRSAIAKSASEVAFELVRRGHQVVVFRTEVGDWRGWKACPAPAEIYGLLDYPASDIHAKFDVVVAHIGDHFGFHGALLSVIGQLPVIGVFHDAFLANLAFNWCDGDEAAVRELTTQTYGEGAWPAGQPYFHDLSAVMRCRPMLEWLARQTVAAVAHAEHYAVRLRHACNGPVAVIPLAFTAPDLPPPPTAWDRITVATVGHANPNKRIDQLVLAVGSSPVLRNRCRVKVIGEASESERAKLGRLERALGIRPIEFTGWLSDDELPWAVRDVDVFSCLRNSALEGASASVILAMSSGRPTLVTNHGCYAEYPDTALLKCAPEHEAADVMRHLENVVRAPGRFRAMGDSAKRLAGQRHSASKYVDSLLPLLEQVVRRRPWLEAADRMFDTLGGFGLLANDPARERLADVFVSMRSQAQAN